MPPTGARARTSVIDEPIGINAQELLRLGHQTKYGFIRKEGGLERLLKCLPFLKWRQRFVVLSQGCVYIYKSDYSHRPVRAFSCRHFKKCERMSDLRMQHCFQVLPTVETGKILKFACISDRDRKEWMGEFKREMFSARNMTPPTISAENGEDYVYLEEGVRIGTQAKVTNTRTVPAPDITDGEMYSVIDDSQITVEVPSARSQIQTTIAQQMIQKQRVRTPPGSPQNKRPFNAAISPRNFEYHGTDREDIERLLIERPVGTYLVRGSRKQNDKQQVLSVNIEGSLKEFKIYEKGPEVTIDHTDYFVSLEELIRHYTKKTLPKKSVTLGRGYKV